MTTQEAESLMTTRIINVTTAYHAMERVIADCGNDYLYKQYFGIKKDSIQNLLTSLQNGLAILQGA